MKTTHARGAHVKKVPAPPPPLPPPSISSTTITTTSEASASAAAPAAAAAAAASVVLPKNQVPVRKQGVKKKPASQKTQTKTGLFYLLDRTKHAKNKKKQRKYEADTYKARRFLVRLKIRYTCVVPHIRT